MIELIDTLKPKNGQTFGLVDANDIIGGYMQVNAISDMNNIPTSKIKQGMLCYVISGDSNGNHMFQYLSEWTIYTASSNNASVLISVEKLTDLNNTNLESVGQVVFVVETGI